MGGPLWLFGLLYKKEFVPWALALGMVGNCLLCFCWFQGTFVSSGYQHLWLCLNFCLCLPQKVVVSVYSKSHTEAQVCFRKGLIFWPLIVDISCKECHKREIASRLFLIIAFVSPLSCSKLSVTWTRAIVSFRIFFCRSWSHKSAFFWVLLSCENISLFLSGTIFWNEWILWFFL